MTTPTDRASEWFVALDPRAGARLRVFAFPHVGAGCSAFTQCARLLPAEVELWSLNLPGRQARFLEPSRTDLEPLVEEVAGQVLSRITGPYVLFGYCSGALLAFLVARRLRERSAPAADRLVVISYAAPDAVTPPTRLHELPAEDFWAAVHELGGFPPELLAEQDYREIFEPPLRADFRLLAQYRFTAGAPLDVPISVIAGRHDCLLPVSQLSGWLRQTTGEFSLRMLPADHWLLEHGTESLTRALSRELPNAA